MSKGLNICLFRECGNHELVWQSLFNLSELLINAHVPNRALIALEESLKYAELSKNKQQRANTLLQIAMVTHVHVSRSYMFYRLISNWLTFH